MHLLMVVNLQNKAKALTSIAPFQLITLQVVFVPVKSKMKQMVTYNPYYSDGMATYLVRHRLQPGPILLGVGLKF